MHKSSVLGFGLVYSFLICNTGFPLSANSDLLQDAQNQQRYRDHTWNCYSQRSAEVQFVLTQNHSTYIEGYRILGDTIYHGYFEHGNASCDQNWKYRATIGVEKSVENEENIKFYRDNGYENWDPKELFVPEKGNICRYYQTPNGGKRVHKQCWNISTKEELMCSQMGGTPFGDGCGI